MTFASAHHAFVNQTEEDLGAEEAVKQLAGVLSTLTKLRKIACSIHDPKHEQRLEKALRTRHVQPFALAEEAHGPSSHIFVRLCPNARYISNLDKASFSYGSEERARKLYDLLHLAPRLDSLEITSSWSTSTLQGKLFAFVLNYCSFSVISIELRNAAPNVSRLLLNGGLLNRSLNIYVRNTHMLFVYSFPDDISVINSGFCFLPYFEDFACNVTLPSWSRIRSSKVREFVHGISWRTTPGATRTPMPRIHGKGCDSSI